MRNGFPPGPLGSLPGLPPIADLTFGAIVAVVRVTDCVPYGEVKDQPFAESGGYCWLLEDPRLVGPIPIPGRLGLFEVPDGALVGASSR